MEAAVSVGVGSEEWALAHDALSKLCLKRAEMDAEEGKWLLRACRAATHAHLGFASFGEYVERLFGLGRRATEEKLRVATALEELPELEQALRSGNLNWSAVREVTRVAAPHTERDWITAAHGKTVREIERLVSGLAPGDRPTDPRRPERVRHVLRFEVGAETLATFREAMRLLQKRSEHRLNDDEALLSMAREVVGGPRDAGRASYQIVVTQCEDCRRGFQHANGELIQLDPAIVEMCHCDAQNVVIAAPSTAAAVDRTTDPVRTASASAKRDAHVSAAGQSVERDVRAGVRDECAAGGAHVCAAGKSVERDVRAGDEVAASNVKGDAAGQSVQSGVDRGVADQGADCGVFEDGSHDSLESDFDAGGADEVDPSDVHVDAGGLSAARRAGMETARGARTEVSAAGGREGSKRPRAMQDTPPAVRREVFFRDCGRCVVPGCRNATYVDLHHLELRSEGGSEDPDNLVVLCGAHHGAVHRGRLRIDGSVSTGLRVRHADGTAYGFVPSPALAEASARAFAGLRSLGFTERTARGALDLALAGAAADASADVLLRAALAHASRG